MGVALVPAGSVVSDTFLSLRRSELQGDWVQDGAFAWVFSDYGTFIGAAESKWASSATLAWWCSLYIAAACGILPDQSL